MGNIAAGSERRVYRERIREDLSAIRNYGSFKDDGVAFRMPLKDLFEDVTGGARVIVSGDRKRIDLTGKDGQVVATLTPAVKGENEQLEEVKVVNRQSAKAFNVILEKAIENGPIVLVQGKFQVGVLTALKHG